MCGIFVEDESIVVEGWDLGGGPVGGFVVVIEDSGVPDDVDGLGGGCEEGEGGAE